MHTQLDTNKELNTNTYIQIHSKTYTNTHKHTYNTKMRTHTQKGISKQKNEKEHRNIYVTLYINTKNKADKIKETCALIQSYPNKHSLVFRSKNVYRYTQTQTHTNTH